LTSGGASLGTARSKLLGAPRNRRRSRRFRSSCGNGGAIRRLDTGPTLLSSTTRGNRDSAMKMIAEYLENALKFERMAAEEHNAELKAALEKQAASYRKLAAERASKLGLPPPPR
jgi:prephenate dehydrogenase